MVSIPKVFAICAISLFSAGIANAQAPSEATMERLKQMGITPDMKAPPVWAIPQGLHRTDTVPSNFPIAVYRSNVTSTTFYNTTKGAPSASLSITTKDPPDVVYRFYQQSLVSGGWRTQMPTAEALAKIAKAGTYFMIAGTRDVQGFNMTIRANPQVAGSAVSINWYINQDSPRK